MKGEKNMAEEMMRIGDLLSKELITECNRLTKIIDDSEACSNTWNDAYGKKLQILDKMQTYDKNDCDLWTKQEERELTKLHNEKLYWLEIEKEADKRSIEEQRNKANLMLEKEKQKVTLKRAAFEIGKLVIPLAISIIHYNYAQRRVFDFEEHGRITSTAGRDLRLPKIFMK